jgi:Nucleoside 2-deoxyribosyltransferase like
MSSTKCVAILAPNTAPITTPSVFLAGSIEMGKARLWQDELTNALGDMAVTVLNPRRPDWNKEWKQETDFKPFKQQVDWEMDHLELADVIALYFQPGTMSPISLLELGLHAASGKVVVCCPPDFWRRGNVEIVCGRYGLTMVETFGELVAETRARLQKCLDARKAAA